MTREAPVDRNIVVGTAVAGLVMIVGVSVGWIAGAVPWGAIASVAAAAGIGAGVGRRWHHERLGEQRRHAESLKAMISLSALSDGRFTYWSPHAVAPETLELIIHLAQSLRARRVLELGSGVSTVFLARALASHDGEGRVDSFDHQERWANTVRGALCERTLSHVASVRVAPLSGGVQVGAEVLPWYELPDLAPAYDLIVVDGPPSWTGDGGARLPALYRLKPWMKGKTVLLLDDANRGWETEVARQWRRDFPDLHFRTVDVGRGLLVVSASAEVFDLLP